MRFITDTISIFGFRLISDGQSPKVRDSQALYTSVPCSIQPAGDDVFTLFPDGIEAARAFVIYVKNTDVTIKNGYMITDQNGNDYIVRGTPERWVTANSMTDHIKVAAEQVMEY